MQVSLSKDGSYKYLFFFRLVSPINQNIIFISNYSLILIILLLYVLLFLHHSILEVMARYVLVSFPSSSLADTFTYFVS